MYSHKVLVAAAKKLGIRHVGRKMEAIYADIIAKDGMWALIGRIDAGKVVDSKRRKAAKFFRQGKQNKAKRYAEKANRIAKRWGLEVVKIAA